MPTPPTSARSSGQTTSDAKDAAAHVAAEAKDTAGDVAADVKDKAMTTASEATSAAKDVAETAKHKAADLADQAKSEAQDTADGAKSQAAHVLEDVSEALRATGETLADQHHDAFASYARTAADQVEQFTASIRDRSVGEILDEAERFARRDPALFIGGAFLLGVVGGRFLKASRPRPTSSGTTSSLPSASRPSGTTAGTASGSVTGSSSTVASPARPVATPSPSGITPSTLPLHS